MYQHIIVVGNVGRDPELRYTQDGTPVAGFSVATSKRWTNREGQPQEKTTWFRVSVFGKQADTVNQYVTKGMKILVEGEIDASAYTAQDGTPRASLDLRATNFRFISSRGETEGAESSAFGGGSRGGGGDFGGGNRGGGGGRPGQRPATTGRPGDNDQEWPDEGGNADSLPEKPDDIPF